MSNLGAFDAPEVVDLFREYCRISSSFAWLGTRRYITWILRSTSVVAKWFRCLFSCELDASKIRHLSLRAGRISQPGGIRYIFVSGFVHSRDVFRVNSERLFSLFCKKRLRHYQQNSQPGESFHMTDLFSVSEEDHSMAFLDVFHLWVDEMFRVIPRKFMFPVSCWGSGNSHRAFAAQALSRNAGKCASSNDRSRANGNRISTVYLTPLFFTGVSMTSGMKLTCKAGCMSEPQ